MTGKREIKQFLETYDDGDAIYDNFLPEKTVSCEVADRIT